MGNVLFTMRLHILLVCGNLMKSKRRHGRKWCEMSDNILELNGLSIEILEQLSYESALGISIKRNLHYFEKDSLIEELSNMIEWYDEQTILEHMALDYRIKSIESILSKYDRYYPDSQMRKVFNDTLGFRAFCDSYPAALRLKERGFRIADLSNGKANDDGYRGVHVYFQKNSKCYPIEIQFNTLYDRQINNWLHAYLYKKDYPNAVGKSIREMYEAGKVRNEAEFQEVMERVLSGSKT